MHCAEMKLFKAIIAQITINFEYIFNIENICFHHSGVMNCLLLLTPQNVLHYLALKPSKCECGSF